MSNNEGSSRRTRPGLSGRSTGFSTRDFNVIDQSVNLMDLQGDGNGDRDDRMAEDVDGAGGLTGLFRNSRDTETLDRFTNSSRFDYEYGDADATDAEEYIDQKRRRHFGTMNTLRMLLRQKKFLLTLIMGAAALVLVLTTYHSFELLAAKKKQAQIDALLEEQNEITNTNATNVGTQHDGYGATNRDPNNNIVLERHDTRKRYNDIKNAIVQAGVTELANFDNDNKSSPQQSALDWLVFEDAAFLSADDDGLLDRYGLAVLWFATNPGAIGGTRDSWKTADKWMSEIGICEWYGIECIPQEQDANKGNNFEPFTKTYDANDLVTGIFLNENNLQGSLPDELGTAFAELTSVDLTSNNLVGTLPATMRESPQLRDFLVPRNQLTGTIPAGYVTLRNLHRLAIGHNNLVGPVWHDEWSNSLTKLRMFSASHNQLTGTLPNFSKMSRMNMLHLSANLLEGSIPETLSGMSSLLELKLNDNKLVGTIDPIKNLENLEIVHVSNNQLTGTIPDMFDQLFRLHDLMLTNNKFTGQIPKTLTHLQTLRYLDLQANQLTGSLPPGLGLLTDVITISLGSNKFEGPIPTILGRLDDIKTLMLMNNQLTGTIPTELGGCFRLQTLHLQSNALEGSIPTQLGGLTGLTSLRVEANKLAAEAVMPPQVCALRDEDLATLVSDCKKSAPACDCCTECV